MTDTVAKLREMIDALDGLIAEGFDVGLNGKEHDLSDLGYIAKGRRAHSNAPALLASVERLQSLEQMLREPGEDVIEAVAEGIYSADFFGRDMKTDDRYSLVETYRELAVAALEALRRKKAGV